jgi:probable DNA repair protein
VTPGLCRWLGTGLRDDSPDSFYDITPLIPALEAGTPVLVPNHRLARTLRSGWARYQAASGRSSWPTPPIFSLDHWWRHCLSRSDMAVGRVTRLATEQQEMELWERCIRTHPESAALLRPRGAAQRAREAYHNLLLWRVDWESGSVRSQFMASAEGSLFLQWLRQFENALAGSGLQLLPAIVTACAAGQRQEKLVLAEFDELPPLYEAALQEQFATIQHHQYRGTAASCELQPCADPEQELYAAARWARDALASGASRIGILLPDLPVQRQLAERVLREVLGEHDEHEAAAFNLSAGVPLSRTAPVRAAFQLLGLLHGDVDVTALTGLLEQPYRRGREPGLEQHLVRRLYRRGRRTVPAHRLRQLCQAVSTAEGPVMPLCAQLLDLSQERALRGRHLPSAWVDRLLNGLAVFGWPGEALGSVEYQQVEQFYEVLEGIAALDPVTSPLDFPAVLGRLQHACEGAAFQPRTASAPVQVLGLLEAAGLQFEQIWICGLDAQSWPGPAAPNPFIPVALQRGWRMPHADAVREREFAERLTGRFVHSAARLVASFTEQADGVSRQPSSLLAAFAQRAVQPVPTLSAGWREQLGTDAVEWLTDSAPPLSNAELAGFRATSALLRDQSLCPFRGFAGQRLQVQPLGELGDTLGAAERGTVLHDALFRLWGELADRASLLALAEGAETALLQRVVQAALDDFAQRDPSVVGERFLRLEAERLVVLLGEWLEVERQRQPFEVIQREADVEAEFGGLVLSMRVDRIDRLDNGKVAIIDYKSGRCGTGDWLGERPKDLQLPLYATVLGDQPAALAFAQVREQDCAYRGAGAESFAPGVADAIEELTRAQPEGPHDWQGLLSCWRRTLERLAGEFRQGDARVAPLAAPETCRYCGLQPLCRVAAGGDEND